MNELTVGTLYFLRCELSPALSLHFNSAAAFSSLFLPVPLAEGRPGPLRRC